jgi:hypothetical protein
MKTAIAILCGLVTIGTTAGVAQMAPASPRGLSAPISEFVTTRKTFEETLRELAKRSRQNVVIGFEPAIVVPGIETPLLDITVREGTVEQALAIMCSSDRRYSYTEVQPGVVAVRAAQEPAQLSTLMSLQVPATDIEVREWPFNLFGRVAELIPELGAYLRTKTLEWSKQTGHPLPGSPGIGMNTGESPPLIKIHLQNTTVRGVLNAFAAYTLAHGSQDPSVQPYLPPLGWRVDFTPDPQAPTGLGGYVKWSSFP